jgi:glycosyltransferase involved in cell wall biosynthesis
MSFFDVVITTYNRPLKVLELVGQLKNLLLPEENVIVVDSSDDENVALKTLNYVHYLRSSHKNQPYQRYLGYLSSDADWIVFLDDDMEIASWGVFNNLKNLVSKNLFVGIAIKFCNKNATTSLSQIPESKINIRNSFLRRIKGFITGYPQLKPGKFGFSGNRGIQPVGGGITEWVSGGAFAAKRLEAFQNFNFQLFDIFEKGLGMGEDGLIGYTLSKRGLLYYYDTLSFFHNDSIDSTYFKDVYSFFRRVTFSRLYISLEVARLNQQNQSIAAMHYHFYIFWRIIGLLLNYILSPMPERKNAMKGAFDGWKLALSFQYDPKNGKLTYWREEAVNDLRSSECRWNNLG